MGAGLVAYIIIITDALETIFQTYYLKDPAYQDNHQLLPSSISVSDVTSSWRDLGLFDGWRVVNPLTHDYLASTATEMDEAEVFQYDTTDMSKVISRRRLRAA